MTWAVQTLRHNEHYLDKLQTTFKLMVRKMLGLKRRPICDDQGQKIGCEPWLDYYKRSMSRAGAEIAKRGMQVQGLVETETKRWASHISRMGLEGKPEHFLKGIVTWRCRHWWESQKLYNDLAWDPILHVFPFKPARWEDQFSPDWMTKFSDFLKIGGSNKSQEL